VLKKILELNPKIKDFPVLKVSETFKKTLKLQGIFPSTHNSHNNVFN